MSNSGGPLPLKTLRLKPLREEEMMSTVRASTGGVQKLQRRRPPPPPSRRKTKRSLRREGIMKRKRKEKPVLQVLLIAALALNTTLSFVVLANRNRMAQATEKKEPVPSASGHNARGRYGRGKNPDRSEPCVSAECRSEIQRDSRSTANGEDRLLLQKSRDRRGKRMRLPFSLRRFSTGSRGIRFSSPEGMAREFLFQKGR